MGIHKQIFPTAAGFGFSDMFLGRGSYAHQENSRPANPSKPSELPRMPLVSCLSPVSSYPPGPLPSRCSVLSTAVARRLSLGVGHSHHAAVPPSSCRPLSPRTATGPFVIALRPSSRPPSRRLPLAPTCEHLPAAPLLKSYCSPERKRFLHTATHPSGKAEARSESCASLQVLPFLPRLSASRTSAGVHSQGRRSRRIS